MNGKKDQKAGEAYVPSILNTFFHGLNVVFFNEKSFIVIFLDKRITFNLITLFVLMFIIPIKVTISEPFIFDIGNIVESIMLTLIYIGFLYLSIFHNKVNFTAFLRIFMAIECVDIFGSITFLLGGNFLNIGILILMAWYLSLSVVMLSRIGRISYFKSTFRVFFAFIFANFIPALF